MPALAMMISFARRGPDLQAAKKCFLAFMNIDGLQWPLLIVDLT